MTVLEANNGGNLPNTTDGLELESRSSESRLTQSDLAALIGSESEASPDPSESKTKGTENLLISDNTGLLQGLPIKVTVTLGAKQVAIEELAKMKSGDIVEMGAKIGEYLEILIGDQAYAQGKLVAIDGEFLGVKFVKIYGLHDLPSSNA